MDIRVLAEPKHYPPITVPGRPGLTFSLWLEFEWWVPQLDDDTYNNFFNMYIYLSTGQKYALNVWTFGFLTRDRQESWREGECLGGRYQLTPDLLVEKLDRQLLEAIVLDLIRRNRLRDEWIVPQHEEDSDSEDNER